MYLWDTINIYKLYNPRGWILYDTHIGPAPSIPWHFPPYTPTPILSVENCWKVEWDQISQIVALAPNSTLFFCRVRSVLPSTEVFNTIRVFDRKMELSCPNQSFMELSTGSNGSKGSTNGTLGGPKLEISPEPITFGVPPNTLQLGIKCLRFLLTLLIPQTELIIHHEPTVDTRAYPPTSRMAVLVSSCEL